MTQTKDPAPRLVPTEDGSYTLFDPTRELHYRSHHGALTESTHVFLEGTGIIHRPAPWEVLELGFGGGLNFLNVAARFIVQHTVIDEPALLSYHAVEWAPIDPSLLDDDAYDTWSTRPSLRSLIKRVLQAARQPDATAVSDHIEESQCRVELHLYKSDWRDAVLPSTLQAQAYFHDPFGPKDNAPAWSEDCFAWAREGMAPTGILATYAAASRVRRAMFTAGLHVATAPGSGRKREMTLASPTPEALAPHKLLSRTKYLGEPSGS